MKRHRLIVTFDIIGARGGDRRYELVDEMLRTHGHLVKVFKQVRLLSTASDPRTLAPLVSAITGPRSRVLIVHAAKPYRFVLGKQCPDADERVPVRNWMNQIK